MGNLDPTKIAIVLVVALVVLGPEKLPGFTKQVGAWWGEFQKVRARLHEEINGAVTQINNVASPLADSFKSASMGVSGLIPPVFTGNRSVPPNPAGVPPVSEGSRADRASKVEEGRREGWGTEEGESGYRYGDPRLN